MNLCAEAADPLIYYRQTTLSINFLISLSQSSQLPLHQSIISHINPNFSCHTDEYIRTLVQNSLEREFKSHSLTSIVPTTPSWSFPQPNIRFDLTKIPKLKITNKYQDNPFLTNPMSKITDSSQNLINRDRGDYE